MAPSRFCLFVAALVVCFSVTGVGAKDDFVSCAEDFYAQGEYLLVIDYVETILSDTLGLDTGDRTLLLRILGSSYVAVGNTESAKKRFKKMLELKADCELDPVFTSPKILSVFEEARQEFETEQAISQPETLTTKLAPQESERNVWLGPAMKSLIVPGLGQFQNGHQKKAYFFISSEVVSLAGLLVSQVKFDEARRTYSGNDDPSRMEPLYSSYNTWFMVRNGFIATSVGICLLSSVDAMIGALESEYREKPPRVGVLPLGNGFFAYLSF